MKTFIHSMTMLAIALVAAATVSAQERYTYDAAGRLASVVYDDLSRIDYTYDANGNILSMKAGISSAPAVTSSADAIAIAVSPNPVAGAMRISIAPARASRVSLDVLSMDGSVAATILDGRDADQQIELEWDSSVLAAGTYGLRVRTIATSGIEASQIRTITVVR